jgi:hypothetical protein
MQTLDSHIRRIECAYLRGPQTIFCDRRGQIAPTVEVNFARSPARRTAHHLRELCGTHTQGHRANSFPRNDQMIIRGFPCATGEWTAKASSIKIRRDALGEPAFGITRPEGICPARDGIDRATDDRQSERKGGRSCRTVRRVSPNARRFITRCRGRRMRNIMPLSGTLLNPAAKNQLPSKVVVPRGGIEPPTPAFSVQCSTN